MVIWLLAVALQDPPQPEQPQQKVQRIMRVEAVPAQPPAQPAAQDGTCEGKCHENQVCAQIARQCDGCKTGWTVCGVHAKLCQACADKKQVCPFCGKALPGSKADAAGRIQKAISEKLPGHKVGRAIPGGMIKKMLGSARVFMVMHTEIPCKTCAANAEPLGVVEYKGDQDKEGVVRLIASEQELSEMLVRQKLSGKAEAALCAAMLVQGLWKPEHGGLRAVQGKETVDPENAQLEKDGDGFKSTFEFKKGHAYWLLHVSLDKDGAFTGLKVEDTGRVCK